MDRLSYVIVFTGDVPGMQWFYETAVGLPIRDRTPDWVVFDTAGAALALHAMPDPERRGIQLRFATPDIDARVRDLSSRGVQFRPPGIETYPWGRIAFARDAEDIHFTLWQPSGRRAAGAGFALSASINCGDIAAQKKFYGETLGFPIKVDSPWWVGLDVGEAGLGLHPRAERPGLEHHHARPITIGFAVPGLAEFHDEARSRGLEFVKPPSDRGYGVFADAVDPDGHEVTFRDAPEPEPIEEQLAEAFEDPTVPHVVGIRRPVVKRGLTSASGSGPAARTSIAGPASKAKPKPRARAAAARRAHENAKKVVSPRGTGPEGSRRKPKRLRDTKRARSKPAIGRLRKAERKSLTSQKVAVASASKGRVPRMPAKKAKKTVTVRSRVRAPRARRSRRAR